MFAIWQFDIIVCYINTYNLLAIKALAVYE